MSMPICLFWMVWTVKRNVQKICSSHVDNSNNLQHDRKEKDLAQ